MIPPFGQGPEVSTPRTDFARRLSIARIFRNNPGLRFTTRSLRAGEDFAVCEWTASTGSKEWDGVDVFPLRDGRILRKDVYSSSHRPREL